MAGKSTLDEVYDDDTLFEARWSGPSSRSSNSDDASIHIFDDNRDVLVTIKCADEALLAEAVAAFNAITPVSRSDFGDKSYYLPEENPSPTLLLAGGEAVASLFESSGYKRLASERRQ